MKNVFISGSIAIKHIPPCVESSLLKIFQQNIKILVGDADGMDSLIQRFCKTHNYQNITVYSIYSPPRYNTAGSDEKFIQVDTEIKREREKQRSKDTAMTEDSYYSFIVWDGISKGSYYNIQRSLTLSKKLKVYFHQENRFLAPDELTANEIQHIYRKNNGYEAKEVVEYLKEKGIEHFGNTRIFNKYLLDKGIINKTNGIYEPIDKYNHLIKTEKYNGKIKGVKFTLEFLDWIEEAIKELDAPKNKNLF
jgi:hypothetical protein